MIQALLQIGAEGWAPKQPSVTVQALMFCEAKVYTLLAWLPEKIGL